MADDATKLEILRRLAELRGVSLPQEEPSIPEKIGNTLLAGAQQTGAGFLNLPVMAGRGISWLLDKAGVPDKPDSLLKGFTQPNYLDEVISGADKRNGPQVENRYGNAAIKGIPGAILAPGALASGPGRTLSAAVLPGPIAEAADAFMGGTPEKPSWIKAPVAIGSGLALGGLLGGRGNRAEADLRGALKGEPQSYFDAAQANLEKTGRVGAKTFTTAEAFPEGSAIQALANKALNAAPANDLRKATENRPQDLVELAKLFANRVGPATEGNSVANKATDAAAAIYNQEKNLRAAEIRTALSGQIITPAQSFGIISKLEQQANATNDAEVAKAFRHVAEKLVGQHGPLTDVQEISFALKRLGKDAASPTGTFQSKGIASMDALLAIKAAEKELEAVNSAYRPAMDQFRKTTQERLMPIQQGPLGAVMDRNPALAGQTPVTKLDRLVDAANSPQTVTQNASRLQAVGGLDPNALARTIVDRRIGGKLTDPSAAIPEGTGNSVRENLAALMQAGGTNPKPAMEVLDVTDRMQKLGGTGSSELPKMTGTQLLIRPFRTIDMWSTGHTEHQTQQMIARILASNDPKGIAELQRIAMTDPSVRKQLSLLSGLNQYNLQQSEGAK